MSLLSWVKSSSITVSAKFLDFHQFLHHASGHVTLCMSNIHLQYPKYNEYPNLFKINWKPERWWVGYQMSLEAYGAFPLQIRVSPCSTILLPHIHILINFERLMRGILVFILKVTDNLMSFPNDNSEKEMYTTNV